MTKNRDYWKKRMEVLEDEQYRRSAAYYKDVQEQFRQVSNSLQMDIERWYRRLADNNGISYASAKKFLRESELEEFRWTVERYIKAGQENAIDQRWMKELENASARHHIDYLTAMKMQAQQYAELLSTEFEGGMADFLHQSFSEQYYRTAWELANGTGVRSNLARIDTRKIDALVKKPWAQDGKNFSDRIWTNKEKLVNNLHRELSQCIIRGEAPQKAIGRLAREMNVSRNQAGNLIMTESAAISSAAQKECFSELDVERYQFDATLDGKTCDVCGSMDQTKFKMSNFEVSVTAPPIHPRCRCCTVPFFDDWEELGIRDERAARDSETGKTVYVDGRLNYEEWKAQFLDSEKDGIPKRRRLTKQELQKNSEKYLETVKKYSTRESKWSGNIVVDDDKCRAEKIAGRKQWNCDILLKSTASDKVIIHEHLHACSGSYLTPLTIIPYSSMEEGSVELLAREICRAEGIPFMDTFNVRVEALREINSIVQIRENDLEFAVSLFGKDIRRRYRWLKERVDKHISSNPDDKELLEELLMEVRGVKQ